MRFDAEHMRSATQGRWASFILPALGIDVPHNPRKHGPCPFCGGKDRFRFDDQDGRGTWFCNQCDPQAGDGFALVQKSAGCTFPEALRRVAGVLGIEGTADIRKHRTFPPRTIRVDRRALAFRFELGALDRRRRAERILEAGKGLHMAGLSGDELDRAIGHMAKAHADIERAELYEGIADALRTREFTERMSCDQCQRVA